MKEVKPEIEYKVGLQHMGSELVRLPDGYMAERHSWKVRAAGELTYFQPENRLLWLDAEESNCWSGKAARR